MCMLAETLSALEHRWLGSQGSSNWGSVKSTSAAGNNYAFDIPAQRTVQLAPPDARV